MEAGIVRTSDQLKTILEKKPGAIRIEGPLSAKIKRTMLIPRATFALASAAAGVAIYSLATAHEEIVYAPVTGGVSTAVRFGAGGTAAVTTVSLLGASTAWSLIGVGIALGGLSGVKILRNNYVISSSGPGWLILTKKQ